MGRDFGGRLAVIEIHLELAVRVIRAFDSVADDDSLRQHHLAQVSSELCGFANFFRNDVPGAFDSLLNGSYALFAAYELLGVAEKRDFSPLLIPNVIRERFQPLLASNGGLSAAFRTVWKVEVFEDALLHC